jgi:5'-methylthioadenosine phosphorylase
MLGVIGGTSLLFSRLPEMEQQVVHTPYGHCEVLAGEIALLLRHQHDTPPHRINHRAHLSALALLGVDRLVVFGSAGSLRKEIPQGSLVIPTDYYSTGTIPSIHEHAVRHVLPGFSGDLNRQLAALVPEAKFGGVYVQTRGPRLETVAEVRALARVGDIVGMTVASEATLAIELGIPIAALCTVDNYAHGLGEEVPSYEHIVESAEQNKDRTGEILSRIVANLA